MEGAILEPLFFWGALVGGDAEPLHGDNKNSDSRRVFSCKNPEVPRRKVSSTSSAGAVLEGFLQMW